MTVPNNILVAVQTYQRSALGYLLNLNCFIKSICNTKFKNFNEIKANLGSSVTFDLPPRLRAANSLVWSTQAAVQRFETLTCNNCSNVAFAFTDQERLFNVEKYGDEYIRTFGMTSMHTLSAEVEKNVALHVASAAPLTDSQGLPTGLYDSTSGPTRFYGNGITAIDSYQKLQQAVTNFKNMGSVQNGIKAILPDVIVPSVVGSGLNQFVPIRNNETAMSWEIGAYGSPAVDYYQSNLLPTHFSGTVGNAGTTLTLVSVNDPSGQNVTQLTFSGATANDVNAIFYGDMFQFQDGVSGKPNIRFLSEIGYAVTSQPVQNRVTAAAGADSSGNVIVNLAEPIVWAATQNQNISAPLQAGMQVKFLPDHKRGALITGDAFYLAMPALPGLSPFYSSSEYDEDTGVSIRYATGAFLGQNQNNTGYDCIWGAHLVPRYSFGLIFPLSQGF